MRTPVSITKFAVLLAILGAAGVYYGYTHGNGEDSISGFSMLIGATLVIIGVGTALSYIGEIRRYRKLVRGETALARWTVSAEEWRAFLEFNEGLEKTGWLRAILPKSKQPGAEAVEMIVGNKGVMIAGTYHELANSTYIRSMGPYWHAGPPPFLEYQVVRDGPDASDCVNYALRMPVSAGADLSRVGVKAGG